MSPPDSYRGRHDDRGYEDYDRPPSSYRARDRSSDHDSYRRAPSSHSHSSYHDYPNDAYDQRRPPRRTSPEYDSYYDRDRPRDYYYDDRRESRPSRSRSPRRSYRNGPERRGHRGASYDSQENYMGTSLAS